MKLSHIKNRIFHFTKGFMKPIEGNRIYVSNNLLLIELLEIS
jgi:hypothetical protein